LKGKPNSENQNENQIPTYTTLLEDRTKEILIQVNRQVSIYSKTKSITQNI